MIGGQNTLDLDDENLWKFLFRSVVPRALMIILAFLCLTSLALSPRLKRKSKKNKTEDKVDHQENSASKLNTLSSKHGNQLQAEELNVKLPMRTKVSEASGDLEWDLHTLAISGVPVSEVPGVLQLANEIGANRRKIEPLCDPLTLLRFLRARDGVVKDALFMYRDTIRWRSQYKLDRVVASFGDCPSYDAHGEAGAPRKLGAEGEMLPWKFRLDPKTEDAKLACKLSFFGMLDKPDNEQDGAPVSIWRVGAVDFPGIKREGLEKIMIQSFVTHLEDVLQSGRAASCAQKRLIRGRLFIDATGTGTGIFRHLGTLKAITSLGKAHFPELNSTVTIVNAPWIFAKVFSCISPFLTQAMRDKIVILDGNFATGLKQHSGMDVSALPRFLGGNTSDEQCPQPQLAPKTY